MQRHMRRADIHLLRRERVRKPHANRIAAEAHVDNFAQRLISELRDSHRRVPERRPTLAIQCVAAY